MFPVPMSRELGQKIEVSQGVAIAMGRAKARFGEFFPVSSLMIRELDRETGSRVTAPSASKSLSFRNLRSVSNWGHKWRQSAGSCAVV